ncbi:MAG TPA: substrate-binding domain-containing protein [Paraburkholderia sp.]|uniref:PstS family phosphate ABC transporter substrate-binding protein n=1 Tax=Paraburkholderia sp. TaxID=1926495 RepID=UPI002ED10571
MKVGLHILGLAVALTVAACAAPARMAAPDHYKPLEQVSGEIRIWGSPADGPLLKDWEAGFARFQTGVTFSDQLHGPESTMAGIYNGVADLAFMGREMRVPVENMAFEWVFLRKPVSIQVANAGLQAERPSTNLAIFVNRRNPVGELTLTQLDAIFGAEHKRGQENFRHWGDLGVEGAWHDRPIDVYGPPVDSIPALFIRHAVLKDSEKWNPDYREITTDGPELLDALARDPSGIAFAPLSAGNQEVKPVALANDASGPFYPLNVGTVKARTYPIGRVITMVLDRTPGKPIEPKVKEFLRYILSPDGQAVVARDGAYIPLSAKSAQQQLKRLD